MPVKITKHAIDTIAPFTGRVNLLSPGTIFVPFFKANWRTIIEISTSWQTAISRAHDTGAGARISLVKRPVRTVKATLTAMSQEESVMLQMSLQNMGRFGIPFPIYPDFTLLNTILGAASIDVDANIRYRRFYAGQRVAFVHPTFARQNYGAEATAIYGEIKDVYDSGFELVDPLGFEIPAGFQIYPLIDVHPNLDMEATVITDNHIEIRLTALEISGQNTLPPSWRGDPNTPLYETYPIFQIDPNYNTKIEHHFLRHGQRYQQGRAEITSLQSLLPYTAWEFQELFINREEFWNYLNFFDSRRGRNLPFWIIQPVTNWNIQSLTTTYVDIPAYDYLQNLIDLITYIGFNTGDIRKIDTITSPAAGTFRITFLDPFTSPPPATYVTPAYLCTFMQDTITEKWSTNTISSIEFSINQELEEKEVIIPNL